LNVFAQLCRGNKRERDVGSWHVEGSNNPHDDDDNDDDGRWDTAQMTTRLIGCAATKRQ